MPSTLDNRIRRAHSTRCIKKGCFWSVSCWASGVCTVTLAAILCLPVQPCLTPVRFLFVLNNVSKTLTVVERLVQSFCPSLVCLGSLALLVWSWHFYTFFYFDSQWEIPFTLWHPLTCTPPHIHQLRQVLLNSILHVMHADTLHSM